MNTTEKKIAILGGGNIGLALAKGLLKEKKYTAEQIMITRRNLAALKGGTDNFQTTDDNSLAVRNADIVVIAVLPQQINGLLSTICNEIDPEKHLIISVVSGVSTQDIINELNKKVEVVRAMPNTAMAIGESMTCVASDNASSENIRLVSSIFDSVGMTIEIKEELMTSATALCACGVAFFLRGIRAASQGGIEIGFHAHDALLMAAQTAKGAAILLSNAEKHPESEIDKVTSPQGCTIAGLNEMEHNGFSSALIKGIKLSADKAGKLYKDKN